MSKPKIVQMERGSVPPNGWYFTSYRLPVELGQRIDRIAQKETKDQGVNISFSTAVIRLLEHAVGQYGPTPGFKSAIAASENARKVYGKDEAAKKPKAKAEKPAKAEKTAKAKASTKAPAKKAKAEKPAKKPKAAPAEEEIEEVEIAPAAAAEVEEEVELSL